MKPEALFKQLVEMMDDELREKIHAELAPCTPYEFLWAYCHDHREKFGAEFLGLSNRPALDEYAEAIDAHAHESFTRL